MYQLQCRVQVGEPAHKIFRQRPFVRTVRARGLCTPPRPRHPPGAL